MRRLPFVASDFRAVELQLKNHGVFKTVSCRKKNKRCPPVPTHRTVPSHGSASSVPGLGPGFANLRLGEGIPGFRFGLPVASALAIATKRGTPSVKPFFGGHAVKIKGTDKNLSHARLFACRFLACRCGLACRTRPNLNRSVFNTEPVSN